MDGGAWQATVHGVTKSQILLSNLAAAAANTKLRAGSEAKDKRGVS